MSDEQEGLSGGLSGDTQGASDVTKVAPEPTQKPSSDSTTGVDRSLTHTPDGKLWRDVANGTKGALEQLRDELAQKAGRYEQHIAGLNQMITERDATIEALKAQIEQLQTQQTELQGKLEQMAPVKERAAFADKLETLMQFPDLLMVRVKEQRVAEDGDEPVEVEVNPYLEMVAASSLEGDDLRQMLSRISKALPMSVDKGQPRTGFNQPTIPTPGTPKDDELESWKAKRDEAHKAMIRGDMSAYEAFSEATENIRRLEAARRSGG